jgi:cell division protein FtsI (penicillin-binding protein 3)
MSNHFEKKQLLFTDNKHNIFSWDTDHNNTKIRTIVVILFFVLCFLTLAYHLIIITNKCGADINVNRYSAKNPYFRKEILDRNGNMLAVNLPSFSLFANPQKIIHLEESLTKLLQILPDLDKKKLLTELSSNKNFVWIKRDISPSLQNEIFNLGLPGFDFEHEQKRFYTFSNLLSHLLGYVGRDFIGLAGLEKTYNQFLTQEQRVGDDQSLILSIDVRLQNILHEEIDKIMREFHVNGAAGIIADPNNGEVLALVSKPDFDPHFPNRASPQELFNNASLGIYEMGSVFKTLTMAIGFDKRSLHMEDAYDLNNFLIGKFLVKDHHPMRGFHSVSEIFLHSSNIGASQIMLEIGSNDLKRYLHNLGLLERLQIELPERGKPLFPTENKWNDLTIATISYGYGLSISPLHFVQAILPVVNGGLLHKLTLLKRNDRSFGTRIFDSETSIKMRQLFRLVVQEGTGKKAEVKGYFVGGKTGTANKLINGRYAKNNSRISSFLGLFPSSNPKYVIYIMLDDPKGNKESFGLATAGWNAAPAVGRVIARMIALYGIEAIDENAQEAQNLLNINYKINNEI